METNEDLDLFLQEIANTNDATESEPTPNLREDDAFSKALESSASSSSATNKPNSVTSLIHENGADSSDDEDMKNFLEQKYNEYGRGVQAKLKKQNEEKIDLVITREVDQSIKKATPRVAPKHEFPKYNPKPISLSTQSESIYTDPVFGIRIIHPLISSAQIKERMIGRIAVPMSSIRAHLNHFDLSKDWAVAGVIVKKSAVLTSKKGAQYVIWKLSDLRGEIQTISLFLFKNAYKQMWKTAEGMVIAILNPGVFDSKQDKTDEACLSVDNPQKFMILGQSKDLGTCRSRKKNGDMCHAIVNLGVCEHCVYHVKQEYSKMSGRTELQSATSGRGLDALRNKVLGKSEVFYGGQSFLAVPAKKNPKLLAKDRQRLQLLSDQHQSTQILAAKDKDRLNRLGEPKTPQLTSDLSAIVNYNKPVSSKLAAGVDASVSQRLKDLERLKQLEVLNENKISTPPPKQEKSLTTPTRTPTLSRSSFSFEVSASTRQSDLAKAKALEILKKKPIEKSNPNFVKYRGTVEGKKRAHEEVLSRDPSNIKKQKITDDAEKFRKERIQKIMEAKSSHSDLIVEHANEAQEKYFSKQLKKEAMEEKMLNTFEIDCKAVVCLKCKYTAFSSADRCKTEGHPIKVIDAKKRFYQCSDCGNRTATVHRMPQMSCKNCQGSRWQRAAMIKERVAERVGEQLSIRGDEEMFLGSLKGNANINLCVAEA
ncbi:Protein MCM10 like [Pseudolycoriella hygida]|uniref:Protein MCM10 homolog n=1 Tax=Pseudolycoriella hygida TaxID=35572 RepID=A0A9Q0NBG8_9DIPT|nr:Protein MCM10 like [Pseudolycoriella hygida]